MAIEQIKTDEDYRAALTKMETLFDMKPNSPHFVEAEQLIASISVYEAEYYDYEVSN